MGFAKNRGLELADRGFGEIEGGLCLDHVTDACLAGRLKEFATQEDCVVCGKSPEGLEVQVDNDAADLELRVWLRPGNRARSTPRN